MSGPTAHVTVEPLSADGLDSFADVWIERREESGLSREAAQRAAADGRLARAVQRDGVWVVEGQLFEGSGTITRFGWRPNQPTAFAAGETNRQRLPYAHCSISTGSLVLLAVLLGGGG